MDTGRVYISAIKVLFLVSLWSGASTQTTTSSTVQSSVTQPTPSLSSSRVDEVIGTTIVTDVVTTASGTAMTSPVVEPSTTSGENGTSMTYTMVEASTASGMLNTAEVPNPSSTVQSAGHSAVQGNVQVVLPGAIERQLDDDFEPLVQELQGKITKKVDPTNSKPSDVNVIETLETMIDKGKAILLKYNDSGKSPVDIFNTTKSLVLVMKKFDCISQMKGSLPNRSDHHVAQVLEKFTDGVDLSFECPRIIINASHPQPSSSRKRREVEIELTVDLTEAGPKDEAVFHDSQLLYHHTRFRRNAVEQGCGQSTCDFKRFETSLTVTNRIFNASLSDESSNDYKGLTQNIKDTLRLKVSPSWFHDMHTFKYELANSNNVKSTFYLDVRSSSISPDGVVNALRSALVNETIGDLEVRNETISSIHRVVVDGNYTQWTAWTACDPTPPNYMRSRSRTCNGRQYGGQCYGLPKEEKHCDCGGLMTVGGNITSPLFPSYYPVDIRCEWLLEAPINETVVLNLTEFDLEKDKKCFYDYMEFYEGNTTNETFRIGHRLCGRQGPQVIKSQGQRLLILFQSDKSDSRSGFRVTWETSRTVSEPIKYVEQYVTTLAMIYSPTVNDTHFPLGTATTCPHPSPEEECVFEEEVFIISRLITALIDRALPLADQNRIVINFEHIMNEKLFPKMYAGLKHCVTWNKTAQGDEPSDDSDPLQSTGGWTRRGCSVLKTNLTHTSCACDHPGLFAVLGQEKLASSKFRLLANTYFGLGISFFILILAIVHIVWKIEIHGGEVMRINMCVAIIVMQSVFLIGAHVKAQQTLCGFLTFAVYFFVLAEFCWLLLHGLRIHGRIKKIFASNLNIEIVYVVIGWGLPLLLALIAIGVQIDLKNPDDVCWKAAAGSAMWGYAAPVIIIALFNMAVLIKLLIPTADVRNNYDYEEMRFRVIKDAIFLAFFGLTCTFAYQAFDKERFLEQYLFSAFVVMQALAMFVLGREGRKDFVKGAEEVHPDNHVTGDEDKPQDPDGEDPHIYESIDEAKGETDLGEGSEKRARKRNPANKTPEKITVTTLKNLNIYKEGGQYVIEA